MANRSRTSRSLSRRRFVAIVAAGAAALVAPPAHAAEPAPRRGAKRATPARPEPPAPGPLQAELARARASTLEALKTIRAHALPVGAESAAVFRPLRRTRGR